MPETCQVCGEVEAKYKCPACAMQTCSLACVRNHKITTSCTGKRARSHDVPIRDFSDNVLIKGMSVVC